VQAARPQGKVGGQTALRRGLLLALVILGLARCNPCLGKGEGPSAAELQRVLPTGYRTVATAEGDFDGDGLREVVVSIADAGARGSGDGLERARAERLVPARVLALKPGKHGLRPWRELPLTGGTDLGAVEFPRLRAVDLVEDRRPELVVMERDIWGGSAGWYDLRIFAYRNARFERIWTGLGSRLIAIGYAEVARGCPGRELVVINSPASWHDRVPWHISVYGYAKGRYGLIQERETTGLYCEPNGADEILRSLGGKRLP